MENKLPQTPQRLQKPTISMQIFVVLFLVILYPFLLASLVRGILSFQWPSPPGNSRRHERIDPIPDVASEFLLTLPPPVFPLSIKALPISTIIYKRNQNSTKDHWLTLFRKCLIWLLSPRIEPVCCFLPIHLDPCKASWKNSHLPTGTPFPPSATRQTLLKKKKNQGIMSNHTENCCRPHITDQLMCQVLSTAYWEGLGHRGDPDKPEQAPEQTCLCHIRMMVSRPNWLEQEVLVVIVTQDWVQRWRGCPDQWTPENQLEGFWLHSSIYGELWHVTSRRGR